MIPVTEARDLGLSPFRAKPAGGLTANSLRLIAIVLMLLDHMWATVVPGNLWMTCVGRLAFPIFAFQTAEGFFHTSNIKKYALRLLMFGLVSEIPFNLLQGSSVFYPFHQNVMFTLLLGLLAVSGLEKARRERTAKAMALGLLAALGCCLLGAVGFVDYGAMGVFTVVLFYLLRGFRGAWLGQLAAMILLNIVLFKGQCLLLPLFGWVLEFPVQGFAVLALIPIWLYNGKKGRSSKALQYGAYAFYPAHILILYLIWRQIG